MKKRIFLSFFWLIIVCVIILSAVLSILFQNAAVKNEKAALRDCANLVSDILGSGLTGELRYSDYVNRDPDAPRLTVIAPDGTVLIDSKSTADRLENHMDRPEIVQALQSGSGESLRYSDTLKANMYYYAVRLGDGNVLRLSKPVGDITRMFTILLPAMVAVALLITLAAVFITRRLTVSIVKPLEEIDFDGENLHVYDELAVYMKKIEQQKRDIAGKLSALSERADTIEAITGNMKEGLILIDGKGEVLTANNSARIIFTHEDFSGAPGADKIEHRSILYVCRDLDFQNAVRQCLSGGNAEISMELGGRTYSVYMSPVFSNGSSRGALILLQDTTERRQAEKQRREFSANVSHELKTPLTTISALSEMIGSGMARDGDVKDFAARISEQAGRLLVLIDDIIRLSEFDEGGAMKESTVFRIDELARSVIDSFRDNPAGVEIELTGGHFDVTADRRMIDELLYNLIDNGVKYNKEGGRVIVDLLRSPDGMCRIAVSDTGIGIPEEHRPRVFERFYRVDKSRSKKTGGTGLGLSIVKHITEYHSGRVELHSSEDNGTTVVCFING